MIIGIDHGYYAIKTKQVCFPTGIIRYEYEPYTMQNVLQYRGPALCGRPDPHRPVAILGGAENRETVLSLGC